MRRGLDCCCILLSVILPFIAEHISAAQFPPGMSIPEPRVERVKRPIRIDDMTRLRHADALEMAPDGRHFAVFVRQGNPSTNDFDAGWFVGSVDGDALVYVGDGGTVSLQVLPHGIAGGSLEAQHVRWSPDGEWIAYKRRYNGEVQLWRSRPDGTQQAQLTHNAADILDFAWRGDGRALYFSVGAARADVREYQRAKETRGYSYDELNLFTDFLAPRVDTLSRAPTTWVITPDDGREWIGSTSDSDALTRANKQRQGGSDSLKAMAENAAIESIVRADGTQAWLVRSSQNSQSLRVLTSGRGTPKAETCDASACLGYIQKIWWADDNRLIIWRREWDPYTSEAIYLWSPATRSVSTILRAPDDFFALCDLATRGRLVCVRETKTVPPHVATIDLETGAVKVVADLNPEFRSIRLGAVERFEWDTPKFSWNEPGGALAGLYPKRAFGYILYPPDFDPNKKYPVIVEPYSAARFENSGQLEQPLHVYAANGFVVLNTQFPLPTDAMSRLGGQAMNRLYSADLEFPHMSMLMESTVKGLEAVTARGFLDRHRVGIGGVSHGSLIPVYMMQKHDLITAISLSSPSWSQMEYYSAAPGLERKRQQLYSKTAHPHQDWKPEPDGEGREFWRKIDIADNVEQIEAPVLMNLAAVETFGALRLIRHLADQQKPYDVYIFPNETHIKWQPAHLHAISQRNLDWFRFWLQDYEDPDPMKQGQYTHWRELRDLQCRNTRSLRSYCGE